MKILSVVGTRPNFIKIAALVDEIKKNKIGHFLVHTGQHYDETMSKLFFDELNLPRPDINLGVGSGSHAEQIGMVMEKLEKVLSEQKPDLVVVVGDVNSTFAAAFVAKQMGFAVAHVEAGLRSFDTSMPEEINRLLTDRMSDLLFTTEESANRNLANEGISKDKIYFTGNVMIDTLLKHRGLSEKSGILRKLRLKEKQYGVLTLHRISNVDNKKDLGKILSIIEEMQSRIKIVFPVHPRTRKNIAEHGFEPRIKSMKNLILTEPLGYLDFLCLMAHSKAVVTDSGGIQEETTVLGVPCITLRNNTERPVTQTQGTNILVSTDKKKISKAFKEIADGKKVKGSIPKLWDGLAGKRIVQIILKVSGRAL
jgi:UDP-N-acetylglucosamine 2-epimerase (non-hydrolysing)